MSTKFIKLNLNWNAQPNSPMPSVEIIGTDINLEFSPNSYLFPDYEHISKISLTFRNCWRYRMGSVNDEGWFRGQCRFSRLAPAWGEFYEVRGNLILEAIEDWIIVSPQNEGTSHYLFYFRDEEFECDATNWTKQNVA